MATVLLDLINRSSTSKELKLRYFYVKIEVKTLFADCLVPSWPSHALYLKWKRTSSLESHSVGAKRWQIWIYTSKENAVVVAVRERRVLTGEQRIHVAIWEDCRIPSLVADIEEFYWVKPEGFRDLRPFNSGGKGKRGITTTKPPHTPHQNKKKFRALEMIKVGCNLSGPACILWRRWVARSPTLKLKWPWHGRCLNHSASF